MKEIDVSDLPEEAVKDVAAYVAAVRQRYATRANGQEATARVRFNVQPGTVFGDLTREEIYDDER